MEISPDIRVYVVRRERVAEWNDLHIQRWSEVSYFVKQEKTLKKIPIAFVKVSPHSDIVQFNLDSSEALQ
jgi:hypothetical protein